MRSERSDIISRLKTDILPLEGLHAIKAGSDIDLGLQFMNAAFPYGHFPLAAVHEFISDGAESAAASAGFISGLISGLMKNGGACIWIGSARNIFPPALKSFAVEPDHIIFIDLKKEKDLLWATEEALKTEGLAAVVAELPALSFTASRRFQLAVEKSRVTGLLLRNRPRSLTPNACVSRWQIKPLPTYTEDELPGLGFPRWQIELLKIRNGKPGTWQVEWSDGSFHPVFQSVPSFIIPAKRKTG